MTRTPEDRTAPNELSRRRLLIATAVGGATALVARPAVAEAAGRVTTVGRADVVGDWYEQVVATTTPFSPPVGAPGVADRMWAISWTAALAALDAGGNREAAVATAVHDSLVALVPDAASRLGTALAGSLGSVRDGQAKQAGIRAGKDAAARTLSKRAGDGLDAASINIPFASPPEAPGIYRLPPGETATQGAGLGLARPFLLGRADRFRPGPPPALGTDRYRRDLQEVQRLGAANSARTERQSAVAWLAPGMQYIPALRALLRRPGHSLRWKVRLLAAYSVAVVDALIASADTKFAYLHWRPITAIRAEADPGWSSYLWTPPHPDYPSAHGVIAGAVEQVFERFTGPRSPVPVTAVLPRGDGTTVALDYPRGERWTTFTQDNVDARVWAGVHFRFSDEVGVTMGRAVAEHDLRQMGHG